MRMSNVEVQMRGMGDGWTEVRGQGWVKRQKMEMAIILKSM